MASRNFKISFLFIAAVFLTLGLSISFQSLLAAYTTPLNNPSACLTGNPGCDAPLNTGALLQTKTGALWINTGNSSPYGLIVERGNVGIGLANPGYKLQVNGSISGGSLCIGTDCKTAWPTITETDPNIYAWARAAVKPSYNFSEISGTVTDAQVPNNITVDYAAGAGNADTVDGKHGRLRSYEQVTTNCKHGAYPPDNYYNCEAYGAASTSKKYEDRPYADCGSGCWSCDRCRYYYVTCVELY